MGLPHCAHVSQETSNAKKIARKLHRTQTSGMPTFAKKYQADARKFSPTIFLVIARQFSHQKLPKMVSQQRAQ